MEHEAQLLAIESLNLLNRLRGLMVGVEELMLRTDELFEQTQGELWKSFMDVRTNAAAIYLLVGNDDKARNIVEETIEKIKSKEVGESRLPRRLSEDPLRAYKLFLVHFQASRERKKGSYSLELRDFRAQLSEEDMQEVRNFAALFRS